MLFYFLNFPIHNALNWVEKAHVEWAEQSWDNSSWFLLIQNKISVKY